MKTVLLEWNNSDGIQLRGVGRILERPSSEGVLLLAGFQRAASTAPKMKYLADRLAEKGIQSLRLDYTGYGLSDGDAESTTLTRMIHDGESACAQLQDRGISTLHVVAHSIGGAVVASLIQVNPHIFKKIILLAPGLNIKDLLKYQILRYMKKGKGYAPSWADALKSGNMTTSVLQFLGNGIQLRDGYIKKEFFLELLTKDFTRAFDSFEHRVLHVYGDVDDLIPIESIPKQFPRMILVKKGDHELDQKFMIEQYLDACVSFLS